MKRPTIGVLALQGAVREHIGHLERCGADTCEVRTPADLVGLDALVLPGGESTTMTLGIEREGLGAPMRKRILAGLPVLATCAGLILLDRQHLDVLGVRCRRNAFGRQIRSFEAELEVGDVDGGPCRAIFIRAPAVTEVGPAVRVLARIGGAVVAVRQGAVEGYAFHPELTDDDRIHRRFVGRVAMTR